MGGAEGDAEERAKALNMMRMLANRQNSRWLEAKEWDVPYTFDATKFPTLLGTLAAFDSKLLPYLTITNSMEMIIHGDALPATWDMAIVKFLVCSSKAPSSRR